MDKLYKYVKANRDQAIILSVFLIVVGLTVGLSFSTVVSFYYLVITYILLFGIFPIGVFLLVYIHYIRFYDNPKKLFLKCIAFITISDIFFFLSAYLSTHLSDYVQGYNYYWGITYFVFILGIYLLNKGKSK